MPINKNILYLILVAPAVIFFAPLRAYIDNSALFFLLYAVYFFTASYIGRRFGR